MANVTTWTKVAVKIQSATSAAQAITGITNADPAVATIPSTTLIAGDYVRLEVLGMSELNGRVVRVLSVAGNLVTLEGEDSTDYGTFQSGNAFEVTMATDLTTATNLNASGGEPSFIDVTTIHDDQQKQIPGNPNAISYTFENLWDPGDDGTRALKKLSDTQALASMMFVFRNGKRVVFTGYASAPGLPTGQAGDKVVSSATITMFGSPTFYET